MTTKTTMESRSRIRTQTYRSWESMKARCYNESNIGYAKYGGRGIRVCPEWIASFDAFFADMGERPPGLTLDRKNNDGNYCPDNCRWATKKDQARNRRSNRRLDFNGESLSAAEWAERFGLKLPTLLMRIDKYGYSIADALTAALRNTRVELDGKRVKAYRIAT